MSKHDHPSFGASSRSASLNGNASLDGNAWDEVRGASISAPMITTHLVATADWLDGELGSFGAGTAPVGDSAQDGRRPL